MAAAAASAAQPPRRFRRLASLLHSVRKRLKSFALLALLIGRLLVPGGSVIAQPIAPPPTSVEQDAVGGVQEGLRAGRMSPDRLHLRVTRQQPTINSRSDATLAAHGEPAAAARAVRSKSSSHSRSSGSTSHSSGSDGGSTVHARARESGSGGALATVLSPSSNPLNEAMDKFGKSASEAGEHISGAERDTIVLLLATALVTPIMGFVGLSPVLGFLFAGMVLGPAGLGVIADVETTTKLAELGVVFFLFEMGLELEFERLKSVGRDAFFLGSSQFVITGLVLGAITMAAGFGAPTALVVGGALALSSSAFVIQLLQEKGELASRFGRASFGILLFQDLAVVPLLVITPLLGGSGAQLGAALRLAAVKSASALLLIFIAGRVLLQRVYKLVASAKDQTSFLAITLVTVLSMSGYGLAPNQSINHSINQSINHRLSMPPRSSIAPTHPALLPPARRFTAALGLSDTLGAFLAGVLLAETKYRYQIEADIAPFRGLLLGLFFITTGFSIDLKLAVSSWRLIVGMGLAIHFIKTIIVTIIGLVSNLKPSVALRSGLLLSQVRPPLPSRHISPSMAFSRPRSPSLALSHMRPPPLPGRRVRLCHLRARAAAWLAVAAAG